MVCFSKKIIKLFIILFVICLISTAITINITSNQKKTLFLKASEYQTYGPNGKYLKAEDVPFFAAIILPDRSNGRGSLIASKFLVTAAHIFYNDELELINNIEDIEIIFNYENMDKANQVVLKKAKKIHIYPGFNIQNFPEKKSKKNRCIDPYDIAIVEIDSEVEYTPISLPVDLSPEDLTFPVSAYVLGLKGSTGIFNIERNDPKGQLYRINIQAEEDEHAPQCLFSNVSLINGSGVNTADSGGPVFINKNGTNYLIGIISGSLQNNFRQLQNKFIKTFYFIPWILNTINSVPICSSGSPCPTNWYCSGDRVPGTQGSFTSRYCTQTK